MSHLKYISTPSLPSAYIGLGALSELGKSPGQRILTVPTLILILAKIFPIPLQIPFTVERAVDDFNALVKFPFLRYPHSFLVAVARPSSPQSTSPSEIQLPRPNTKR